MQRNIQVRVNKGIEKARKLRSTAFHGYTPEVEKLLEKETPENRRIYETVLKDQEELHELHLRLKVELQENMNLMAEFMEDNRNSYIKTIRHSENCRPSNDSGNTGNSPPINIVVTPMLCDEDSPIKSEDSLKVTEKLQNKSPKSTKNGKKSSPKRRSPKKKEIPEPITESEKLRRVHIAKALRNLNMVNDNTVLLGSNGTTATLKFIHSVNWAHTNALVVRRLLCHLFPRVILATHSLTGKTSPAFIGKCETTKLPLDASKVADIVEFMNFLCLEPPNTVRAAITTKCADENKMLRNRNERMRLDRDYIPTPEEIKELIITNTWRDPLKEKNKTVGANNNIIVID